MDSKLSRVIITCHSFKDKVSDKIEYLYKSAISKLLVLKATRNQIHSNLRSSDEMPEDIREPGIKHGYRAPGISVKELIISSTCATNETLNFWTHFVASLFLCWFTFYENSEIDFENEEKFSPLLFTSLTCILYTFWSSFAHLFCNASIEVFHFLFYVDYFCLSIYTFGTSVSFFTYVYPHSSLLDTTFYHIYLEVAALLSFCITFSVIKGRTLKKSFIRNICTIISFLVSYLWVISVVFERLLSCFIGKYEGDFCQSETLKAYIMQIFAILATGLTYGSHFPEVMYEGRFDIFGHSHQIMHITGALTTYLVLKGSRFDSMNLHFNQMLPYQANRLLLNILITGIVNVAIVTYFTVRMCERKVLKIL